MRLSLISRQMKRPEMMGFLADSSISSAQIIERIPLGETANENIPSDESRERLDIKTLQGRSPNENMARIPSILADRISQVTKDSSPQELRQKVAKLYQNLQQGQAHQPAMASDRVDVHIMGLVLQNYTSIVHTLREVKARQPDFMPKSILDVGFGPATGLLAAREVFGDQMQETAVIHGHPRLRSWAREFLRKEELVVSSDASATPDKEVVTDQNNLQTKFKYELPSAASMKRFDLIIATHQLYQNGGHNEELVDSHAAQLAQLADKNGGVVVFIERGDPMGFESVALARGHLLRPKYKFSVVGPCTHDKACPLQVGINVREANPKPSSQNWCRFNQKVERPRFSKELKKGQYLAQKWSGERACGTGGASLKGSGRPGGNNHEVATFSWVALRNKTKDNIEKGDVYSWPRIMKQPLKRTGHVLMEVCTPEGSIEHWTVPRSQGKQAYHDARKARAADIWALDAKSKQVRGGIREKKTEQSRKAKQTEPSIDWWLPKSNPCYKHATHQARIQAETFASYSGDSSADSIEALLLDTDSRASKLHNRESQRRYK